jgi:AAA15 family ATPase/GTPase
MQLTNVSIKNFRSIENAEIDFIPSCKALIGINESGKTNVLHALAMLSSDRKPQINDLRETRPTEDPIAVGFVRFFFALMDSDYAAISKSLTSKILADNPLAPMFDVSTSIRDLLCTVKTPFYEVDLTDQTKSARSWRIEDRKVITGWLMPKPNLSADIKVALKTGAAVPLVTFSIVHQDSLTTELQQHCVPLDFNTSRKTVSAAIRQHVESQLPDCFLWSYSDQQLLPPSVSMAKFVQNPTLYEPLRQMFSLAGFDNVSEAIETANSKSNGIRNLLNRVSEAATKHMRSVWKDYKTIEINVQPNGENIEVNIKDTYNVFDFSRRSDGFKRFISFLFLVSAKTRNGTLRDVLYLHDEPDTGLHPSGSRHLLNELIKVSKDNYVVFSTHSIFMIDRGRIDRHYIVRKAKEVTTLEAATSSNFTDEEVLYNALQFSSFDVLKPTNILFEGWKDKRLFELAIEGNSDSAKQLKKQVADIGFCHAQGVKDVAKISSVLELANRHWIVISDGDGPARDHQKIYSAPWKDRWLRYDQLATDAPIHTSEDFFEIKYVVKFLQAACKRHSAPFPKDFQMPDYGKLMAVQNMLKKNGMPDLSVKAIISDVKDEMIANMKASDLRTLYFETMLAAVTHLQTMQNT